MAGYVGHAGLGGHEGLDHGLRHPAKLGHETPLGIIRQGAASGLEYPRYRSQAACLVRTV